jgi:predicted SprT family Zn-dependent metalloprotease
MKIKINGQTVTIKEVDQSKINGNLGMCYFDSNAIEIIKKNSIVNGRPIPHDRWCQVLWHELAHYAMYAINDLEFAENETKVDNLACVLDQIYRGLEGKL